MTELSLDLPESHDDLDGVPPPQATLRLFGREREWVELVRGEAGNRLHHAWLFQGPRGVGKASTAFAFARYLLSDRRPRDIEASPRFAPDDATVRQIALGSHPNLIHITRPPVEKGTGFRTQITVEEVRKLNRFFHATASGSNWRIALIDPADDMNRSAANALLKILEEPPPRSLFLITNHTPGRLLATIRSRARLLQFDPLDEESLTTALAHCLPTGEPEELRVAARLAGGSVRQAISLVAHGGIEIRRTLEQLLRAERPDWNAIHSLADALTLKGREAAYELLVAALFEEMAGSSEARLRAGDGEGAAALAALWQDETARLREAGAYNLDRKQVLLTLFDRFYKERSVRRAA